MHVKEGYTRLCPEKLCKRITLRGRKARAKVLFDASRRVSLKQWVPAAIYRRLYPPGRSAIRANCYVRSSRV